uniref:Cytoplasmic protein n=1 Tax=Ascaris lumbricoides TaxID=6252 RepID=A0A0M3I7C6_ASCLU
MSTITGQWYAKLTPLMPDVLFPPQNNTLLLMSEEQLHTYFRNDPKWSSEVVLVSHEDRRSENSRAQPAYPHSPPVLAITGHVADTPLLTRLPHPIATRPAD